MSGLTCIYVQTVSSIQFELDEDLSDDDMAKDSVATKSKEILEWGRSIFFLI